MFYYILILIKVLFLPYNKDRYKKRMEAEDSSIRLVIKKRMRLPNVVEPQFPFA